MRSRYLRRAHLDQVHQAMFQPGFRKKFFQCVQRLQGIRRILGEIETWFHVQASFRRMAEHSQLDNEIGAVVTRKIEKRSCGKEVNLPCDYPAWVRDSEKRKRKRRKNLGL
jgi:hypothetical protein